LFWFHVLSSTFENSSSNSLRYELDERSLEGNFNLSELLAGVNSSTTQEHLIQLRKSSRTSHWIYVQRHNCPLHHSPPIYSGETYESFGIELRMIVTLGFFEPAFPGDLLVAFIGLLCVCCHLHLRKCRACRIGGFVEMTWGQQNSRHESYLILWLKSLTRLSFGSAP